MINYFLKKHSQKTIKVPDHIAIIMDGNARYSSKLGLPIQIGHKTGAENVKKIAKDCIELGIKFLTLYAFSSENWMRPKEEVNYLMQLLHDYLSQESSDLMQNGIKIMISGNLENIDQKLKAKIHEVEDLTKNNNKLTLIVAFSYGARQEIIDSTKKIVTAIMDKKISIDDIDENLYKKFLYIPSVPYPDLLIRTAGDLRVSNFMLWQIAYTEFYFSNKLWPEFNKSELLNAINNFNQRARRYGKR